MRLNSEFYLARSAGELSRIVESEGDALSHRSRVHLTRMARALLFAAGETGRFAHIDATRDMHLDMLADEMDRLLGTELRDDGSSTDRVAARLRAAREAALDEEAARIGGEAIACLAHHRDALDEAIDALAGEAGASTAAADEGNVPPSAEALTAHLRKAGHDVTVTSVSRLWTESSKEISLVETDGGSGWPQEAVMRRERPYAIVANSVAEEFDVLAAAHGAGLPAPRPLFAEHDPAALGARLIIAARLPGAIRSVATIGISAEAVLVDAATVLAGLHRIDPASVPNIRAQMDAPVRERLRARILDCEAEWRAARIESESTMEAAFAWLLRHVDRVDEDPVIVHGDFDLRNMLVDEGRLSGILDWEFAKLGHRGEDLGYFHDRVTQLMPWHDFMRHYQQAGGLPIDPFMVQFHRVLAWTLRTRVVVNAYSGYWREQHADYRLGSTAFCEYPEHLRYLASALLDD